MGVRRRNGLDFKSTEYKYVQSFLLITNGIKENKFRASIPANGIHRSYTKICDNIKCAAKAVDLKLIERGKEPVNILVRN